VNAVDINANSLRWQPALSYPSGAEQKVLNQGGSVAPRSILLRIPPGWKMERHSHRFTELHYVIEGGYESGDKIHPAGTFRMIPKEVEHGPFATGKGAIILVIWCKTVDLDE
jgi:anti-sigma factor ChrR (cupin superfamily)